MKNIRTLAAAALFCFTVPAFAGDVIVIAHSGVTATQADLKDIFTGEKQFAGSVKLTPVDNSAAQADFLSKALKMDKDKYGSIWTKKGFRDGLNAPSTKSGDAEVIEFVKRTPGAIGYVTAPPAGANVIAKF